MGGVSEAQAQATELLQRFQRGDAAAGEALMPVVYRELRQLAQMHMARQPSDHTLQPTALVHEAFLKLVGNPDAFCESRAQFYRFASTVMRSVLVDHARTRGALKRGGRGLQVELDENLAGGAEPNLDLLALDEALRELSANDAQLGKIVELRFFGGLTAQETADALGM